MSDAEPAQAPKKKMSLLSAAIFGILLAVSVGLNLRPTVSVSGGLNLRPGVQISFVESDLLVTTTYGFPLLYHRNETTRHPDGSIAVTGSGNKTEFLVDKLVLNVLMTVCPSLLIAFWVGHLFAAKADDLSIQKL